MRVVHLSTDDVTGGAARCALRLHQGLSRIAGVDSTMIVDRLRGSEPGVVAFKGPDGILAKRRLKRRKRRIRSALDEYASVRPDGFEPFNPDASPYGPAPLEQAMPCEVINLHWVARFLGVESLAAWLPAGLPVVWTLHDMHLLTGGCHYDHGCGKFQSGCGACPQLGSSEPNDLARHFWDRKRRALAGMGSRSIEIVTPSRWLAREAKRSGVIPDGWRVRVIPYGLDTALFAPGDRGSWRARYDIPAEANVLLFVAQSVENRRKGFVHLRAALDALEAVEHLWLVSVGKGEPSLPSGVNARHLGEIRSDEEMAGVYGMADVFCVPSLQDNLPATVLESLATGTPVAGFDVGGIPDMVRPGETGALADAVSGEALAVAIRRVLEASGDGLRARCRDVAETEYSLALQAARYLELYGELTGAEEPEEAVAL